MALGLTGSIDSLVIAPHADAWVDRRLADGQVDVIVACVTDRRAPLPASLSFDGWLHHL